MRHLSTDSDAPLFGGYPGELPSPCTCGLPLLEAERNPAVPEKCLRREGSRRVRRAVEKKLSTAAAGQPRGLRAHGCGLTCDADTHCWR